MISALVSAYYAHEFLPERLKNLEEQGAEMVVICQRDSREERIARWYCANVVLTDDIPTIGKAWNLGIEAAGGEYLTTANSDDLFKPGGLDTMAKTLDDFPNVGLVFADVDRADRAGSYHWVRTTEVGIIHGLYDKLRSRCYIGPMPLWRRSLHDIYGYFDEEMIVACDYDFWLRIARGGVKFVHLPMSLGVYQCREDSLEHRNKLAMRREKQIILERNSV